MAIALWWCLAWLVSHHVAVRCRLEDGLPVRMPLPRASAAGLPGGGIYALHTTIENKAFGEPKGLTRSRPKL